LHILHEPSHLVVGHRAGFVCALIAAIPIAVVSGSAHGIPTKVRRTSPLFLYEELRRHSLQNREGDVWEPLMILLHESLVKPMMTHRCQKNQSHCGFCFRGSLHIDESKTKNLQ
jgi:hypothetical protein